MRRFTFIILIAVLCGGLGCKQSGNILGKAPRGDTRTVLAIREGLTPRLVTIQGKMITKCPTAGCWFDLKDKTGAIRVDTKTSGFVVTKIPLQAEVTVSGKLVFLGDEPVLEATGVRF